MLEHTAPGFTKELPPLNKRLKEIVGSETYRAILASGKRKLTQKEERLILRYKDLAFFRSSRIKRFLGRLSKCISVLHDIPLDRVQFFIRLYIAMYEKIALFEGSLHAVKKLKEIHGIVQRYCASQAFTPISFLKCRKDGLPLLVAPLKKYLKGTTDERKACLTVLSLFKLVIVPNPDVNYKGITDPGVVPSQSFNGKLSLGPGDYFKRVESLRPDVVSGIETNFEEIKRCWLEVLEDMFPSNQQSQRLEDLKQYSTIHVSSKSGPNGPALGTIAVDYKSLLIDVGFKHLSKTNPNSKCGRGLLFSIIDMVMLTNNKDLRTILDQFRREPPDQFIVEPKVDEKGNLRSQRNFLTSKISLKDEPGGKVRAFAICDWFSQSALAGLNEYLFDLLGKWSEDGTHSHNRIADIVRAWTILPPEFKGTSSVSADLTEATNRIPAEIQAEILTKMFGHKFSETWLSITKDRYFLTPEDKIVKYEVGQPMGILSSWAMLAVWHHVVLRTCLKLTKKRRNVDFNIYCIIGDDVAFLGEDLFRPYHDIVNKLCGVELSPLKGYSSITNIDNNPGKYGKVHAAEVAKRVFLDGEELTPVPPDEFLSGFEYPADLPSLIASLNRRGYKLDRDKIDFLCSLNYKYSQAKRNVSFPLFAPHQFDDLIASYLNKEARDYEGYPWFDTSLGWNLESLNSDLARYLQNRISKSVLATRAIAKQLYNQNRDFVSGRYKISSSAAAGVFKTIGKDVIERLSNKAMSPDSPIFKGSLKGTDLRAFIGSLHLIFDLQIILKGKKEMRDEKKKTSRFIYEFQKFIFTEYENKNTAESLR